MANILVFQHSEIGTPGRLGLTLRDHGFHLDIRRLDLPTSEGGAPLPPDLDNVHGVVSLGGPQNVGDPEPWLEAEADLLRRAHEAELPVVGICLGAQLIAHALGGTVEPMERPEIGFHEVHVEVPGQTDTIMAGIPWTSRQFCHHGQSVTAAPEGATVLARSAACPIQAFRAGIRTFAFQYHFEATHPMIESLAGHPASRELNERAGLGLEEILAQRDRHYDRFATIADRLCVNLATYEFPFARLLAV